MNFNNRSADVTLTTKCPLCGRSHTIMLDRKEYYDGMTALERGALIQEAFPNFTPTQREFIMTGICNVCWDNM